jgi:hypothetical protein
MDVTIYGWSTGAQFNGVHVHEYLTLGEAGSELRIVVRQEPLAAFARSSA